MNYFLIKTAMKKTNQLKYIFLIIIFSFVTSCQSVKDGLSGRKSENSDEFLVQKKNPLVMPPDFEKLPKPSSNNTNSAASIIDQETDIQKILKVKNDTEKKTNKNFGKAEEFVLENIK